MIASFFYTKSEANLIGAPHCKVQVSVLAEICSPI